MSSRLDPETRQGELLEAASDLFLEKGYRNTSVSSIVESIGVSKGTFYYYFDSKEDVVDGLVERISKPIYRMIDEIVADNSLTVVEKLNKIFSTSTQMELDNDEIVQKISYMVYKPENLRLRNKLQKEAVEKTAPKITKVVRQGVEKGTLDTPFPEDVGRLIVWMGIELEEEMANSLLSSQGDLSVEEYFRKYQAYANAIERVLGLQEGSIELLNENDLKEFLSYLGGSDSEEVRDLR